MDALSKLGVSAYVAEPGPNALYYANLSQRSWYTSERPLLLAIKPEFNPENNKIDAKLFILTPKFEAARAKLLSIPSLRDVTFIEWAEAEDPFAVLARHIDLSKGVVGDEMMRYFVVSGMAKQISKVVPFPPELRQIREQKSAAELRILSCANEVYIRVLARDGSDLILRV